MGAGIHLDPETPAMHIGSPFLQAKVAICDPELTMTLPPTLTAGTGMDALNQCIEGYLSVVVNPPIDAVALDGLRRAYIYIERAVADGSDREARWEMLMVALEGGISIGKTLGPGHAIANTFGDRGFHHGVLVTVAMPSVLRFLDKYAEAKMKIMAETMGLKGSDTVADAVERLNAQIGLPKNLREMGYVPEDLDSMAEICELSVFNRNTPHRPTKNEYMTILTQALA
jgi:alcohol dehydrogenase class IV